MRNVCAAACGVAAKTSRNEIASSFVGYRADTLLISANFGVDIGRGRSVPTEGTAMGTIGAVYQPEVIELMNAVLDDAIATLPEAKRTSAMKAEIASHILASAAKGERDPISLKMAALLAVVECSHYSHDISPQRRAV
jgi:hypothetical protein